MVKKQFLRLFFIFVLVFLIVFPSQLTALDLQLQDTASFRIEVTEFGFNGASEEVRLEVEQGQEVEITFVYADRTPYDNPHRLHISGYNITTDLLDKGNTESTVSFIANNTGEFTIACIEECTGHGNLQNAKLVVLPTDGATTDQSALPKYTLILDSPEKSSLIGEPLTLIASIKDEFDKPLIEANIRFYIKTDFFVKEEAFMEIGEVTTDNNGLARIEYIPREEGKIDVIARYDTGTSIGDIETDKQIEVLGDNSVSFYKTFIGIGFPDSFLIWMIVLAVIVIGIWGTFIFVLSQVTIISRGSSSRKLIIILLLIVVALSSMLLYIILTPETQFNFGLML